MIRRVQPSERDRPRGVDLEEHLNHSLKEHWREYRKAFRHCQDKFSEKAVHDLRIQTRRLLSLLTVVQGLKREDATGKKARQTLKKILGTYGKLRDTHVQLLQVEPMLKRFPEAQDFHAALVKKERRQIRRAEKRVRHIRLSKLGRCLSALRQDVERVFHPAWGNGSGLDEVLAALDAAFAEVVHLFQAIEPADLTTLHRTRVAFKKFRYMVEALHPLLPGISGRQIKAMRAYQAMMGSIQDGTVLQRSLDKFDAKKGTRSSSLARFQAALAQRRQELMRQYLRHHDQLLSFWPRPAPLRSAAAA